MKQFRCSNVVDGCDGVVTGESDDEVLAGVARHAASVHGMTSIPDELVARVRAGISDG